MISLLEFIKTGQLGSVQLGQKAEEVVGHLGEPDDSYDDGFALNLEYGIFEFSFSPKSQKLYIIMCMAFNPTPSMGVRRPLDTWILDSSLGILDCMRACDKEGLTYTFDPSEQTLNFASGVCLMFNEDKLGAIALKNLQLYEE